MCVANDASARVCQLSRTENRTEKSTGPVPSRKQHTPLNVSLAFALKRPIATLEEGAVTAPCTAQVYATHNPYDEVRAQVPWVRARFVTVLRDPLSRVWSFFNYVTRKPTSLL